MNIFRMKAILAAGALTALIVGGLTAQAGAAKDYRIHYSGIQCVEDPAPDDFGALYGKYSASGFLGADTEAASHGHIDVWCPINYFSILKVKDTNSYYYPHSTQGEVGIRVFDRSVPESFECHVTGASGGDSPADGEFDFEVTSTAVSIGGFLFHDPETLAWDIDAEFDTLSSVRHMSIFCRVPGGLPPDRISQIVGYYLDFDY